MENNARIRVVNRQTIDGDTDIIEEHGEGIYSHRGGKHYIMYDTDDAEDRSRVTVIAEGRNVRIKRAGSSGGDMLYNTSQKTAFKYRTPYGALDMEINTERICNALNAEPKKLRIKYTLTMQGQRTYNDTEIYVEEI
ncbi:MAG: DUF1934 domain-containing protein [bacterium]|nr:DUF1934 domain-containing protein [bacterium]